MSFQFYIFSLVNSKTSGILISNLGQHCNNSRLQVSHHRQPIYHLLPFQTPRLIFQMTQPDPKTEFFIAYFSQDGRRFTLVNPPNHIELSMGARLRSALPNKILYDNAVEEYTRVIEVKRKPNSNGQLYRFHGLTLHSLHCLDFPVPEVEEAPLFVEVLRILSQLGFQLDATIPLGRRGPLGIRYMRELLIFKGYLPREG